VGNPAEETCCYPNEFNVTLAQLFVNKVILEYSFRLYPMFFYHTLNLWSGLNPFPCFVA